MTKDLTKDFLVIMVGLLGVAPAMGQAGLLPLSDVVEAPYRSAMHRYRVQKHTAIHPYFRRDLEDLEGVDSARTKAALPLLDRWAGRDGTARFRGGPLLDAAFGASIGEEDPVKYRAGAGAWLEYDAAKDLTLHVDGQVWNERLPNYMDSLVKATQVTAGEGYAYGDGPSYTHYEVAGHANWAPSRYFNFTLGRGRNFIGEGHRSLFLSDNAYSYPYFKITATVWHLRYVNLFTRMSDIRGSGGDIDKFARKYASFHYLSWNASKRFNFGVFEGIVWQDNDPKYPRGFDVNYLNPVVLYRPVEFASGSPDNALLGFAVNVKVAMKNTLYSQVMLDEFLVREVRSGEGWFANKQAFQVGGLFMDAFQVPDLTLRVEWNYVRPFMYTHADTRQNYSHAGQPLAHPYGSNFSEVLAMGEYRSGRWSLRDLFSYAYMGRDTGMFSWGNDIFRPESDRPERDLQGRKQNYGYYLGGVLGQQVISNDLRVTYMIDPHTGLGLEASYLMRANVVEEGEDVMTHYFRVGLVCRFRNQYAEQQVRGVLP